MERGRSPLNTSTSRMTTGGNCPHPPPPPPPPITQALRPQSVVKFLSEITPNLFQYALLHSSRFISWPIFARLLITEAKYDASAVTPGEEEKSRSTASSHFRRHSVISLKNLPFICSHLSVSGNEADYLYQIIN